MGEWAHKFQRHLYPIILWLDEGIHDQTNLNLWQKEVMRWFQTNPERVSGPDLALEAVTFINAGGYDEFLELASPTGVDLIKCSGANERQMALTLAVQALTHRFSDDKVEATINEFLDNHVGKWLKDGHALRAAEWMKVIYWRRDNSGNKPYDAVRKCFDHVDC